MNGRKKTGIVVLRIGAAIAAISMSSLIVISSSQELTGISKVYVSEGNLENNTGKPENGEEEKWLLKREKFTSGIYGNYSMIYHYDSQGKVIQEEKYDYGYWPYNCILAYTVVLK